LKPRIERVSIPSDCSIRVYDRRIPHIPFEWRHHPQVELTLTLNSRGLRLVGGHVGSYESPDLVLIPPDMPHTWTSRAAIDRTSPHQAVVLRFTEKWAFQIAGLCPEYRAIAQLLNRSARTLSFGHAEAELMRKRMPELLSDSSPVRLHAALALLAELSEFEGTPLASIAKPQYASRDGSPKLDRVLDLLHNHYSEQIRVEDLCAAGNMSPRTLHRVFAGHLGVNVSDYLRKLRVGHACMLLVETDLTIGAIAARAGFSNLSNFNRAFLKSRQMTPMELRGFVRKNGRLPKLAAVAETVDSESSFILRRDKTRHAQSQAPQ